MYDLISDDDCFSTDKKFPMSCSSNWMMEFGDTLGLKSQPAKNLRYRLAFEQGSVHFFNSFLKYFKSLLCSEGFGGSGRLGGLGA